MRKERRELNRREQQGMYSSPPSIPVPTLPLMVFSGVLFFFLLLENDETYNTSSNNSTHHGFLQLYLIVIFVLLYVHVTMGNVRWLSRRQLCEPMGSRTVNGRSSSFWGLVLLLVLLPAMVRYRVFFTFLFAFLFLLWSYAG